MIWVRGGVNTPNYFGHNESVTEPVERAAGCYAPHVYGAKFMQNGAKTSLFEGSMGEPICQWVGYACNDGSLSYDWYPTCAPIRRVDFECAAHGSNRGCRRSAICPWGTHIIGARAACNLEWGSVSDTVRANTRANTIKVVRASDHVSDGRCDIDDYGVRSGSRSIAIPDGRSWVSFGCAEHDKNGGECHIKGTLYCQ